MEDQKKVAIVGAGLAGLSAGIHLARNGFSVTIFEMHDIPGGQCTSWKKGKFTFDGCVHWLVGSKAGGYMNHLWEETGALKNTEIINHDRYMTIKFPDQRELTFYADPDLLEKELLVFSPEDKKEIRSLVRAIRFVKSVRMVTPDSAYEKKKFSDIFSLVKMLFSMVRLIKWIKISSREYSLKFKSPQLRTAIENLFAPEFAMLFNLFTFAWLAQGNAGYPVGGSLKLSKNIAETFETLGGKIRYKSRVARILVKENQAGNSFFASGIELESGEKIHADYVISAADGLTTLNRLLGRKFHNPRLKKAWDTLIPFDPLFYISIGYTGKLKIEDSVSGTGLYFEQGLDTGGKSVNNILIHNMSFDRTLAPEGKSVIEIMCISDFDFWKNLREADIEKYYAEKKKLSEEIIHQIDKNYFPGFRKNIEKIDVATPTTWEYYTGVSRGAFEGWQMTKDVLKTGMSLPKKLNNLDNFFLCGQWLEPGGGLPTAVYSGKNAAYLVTKAEGRKFTGR